MYNISNVDAVKSYATEANARKAVVKVLGEPDSTTNERRCNVLIVRNTAGRFVPICINITGPFLGCLAQHFMVVN